MDPLDDLIAKSTRAQFGPPVSEDVISDAERVLGIAFPVSYRQFLARYGGGYLDGYELQGLFPIKPADRDPTDVLVGDVVYTTQLNRRHGLPFHLIELLSYEGDEIYFLDLSQAVAGEAPVVCRNSESPEPDELNYEAATFEAFLRPRL